MTVLKDRYQKVGGVYLTTPPPLRLFHGKLEDVPGPVGYLYPGLYRVLAWYTEVFIEEGENLSAINLEIIHDLHKEERFMGGEGEKDVLHTEIEVVPPLALLDVKAIEDALAEGKKALEQDNVDELKKAMENITQASHKVAEVLYKQSPPEGGAPGEGAAGGAGEEAKAPEGDVVDAEVVEDEKTSA